MKGDRLGCLVILVVSLLIYIGVPAALVVVLA